MSLTEFLHDIRRGQEAVRKATATIEAVPDLSVPGRTSYRITGASAAVVQSAIDTRIADAEANGGSAEFTWPRWKNGRYEAVGYVNRNRVVLT